MGRKNVFFPSYVSKADSDINKHVEKNTQRTNITNDKHNVEKLADRK